MPIDVKYMFKKKTTFKPFFDLNKSIIDNKNITDKHTFTRNAYKCKLDMKSKDYLNLANALPIQSKYLSQLFDIVGLNDDVEKLLDRKHS